MSSNTILKPYDGLNIPFTSEGYLNATVTAAHFGKRPIDWMRLPETKAYISQLCDFLTLDKNQLVVSKNGSPENGGGTWLHRKLAVPFARWCDVRFAIWCDHQIEIILSNGQVGMNLPMVRDRRVRDLAYCIRIFGLSNDLWSKQQMLYVIKRLCHEMNLPMPPAHLLGQSTEQYQLEV